MNDGYDDDGYCCFALDGLGCLICACIWNIVLRTPNGIDGNQTADYYNGGWKKYLKSVGHIVEVIQNFVVFVFVVVDRKTVNVPLRELRDKYW